MQYHKELSLMSTAASVLAPARRLMLVADDELTIRNLVAQVARQLGFEPLLVERWGGSYRGHRSTSWRAGLRHPRHRHVNDERRRCGAGHPTARARPADYTDERRNTGTLRRAHQTTPPGRAAAQTIPIGGAARSASPRWRCRRYRTSLTYAAVPSTGTRHKENGCDNRY